MRKDSIMENIQIENFRSLKDTGVQRIAPITLLVGENSSGKSSFLRAFPLLKQSLKKHTSGPILWAGDSDDYVDFGSFKETITNVGSEVIYFRFQFTIDCNQLPTLWIFSRSDDSKSSCPIEVTYRIGIKSSQSRDEVVLLEISLGNKHFVFDFEGRRCFIDGVLIDTSGATASDIDESTMRIHPRISFRYKNASIFDFELPNLDPIWKRIERFLVSAKKHNDDLESYVLNDAILERGIEQLCSISTVRKESRFISDATRRKLLSAKGDISDAILLFTLYALFPHIEDYILDYFNQVHYIAPLRATAERYYRLRNLAVDEVDYQGKNLAIFINSLTKSQVSDFQSWTIKHFGFSVHTQKTGGHISLSIKLKDSKTLINLSDTGFGYSQVLPIITQLWDLSSQKRESNNSRGYSRQVLPLVIAIEQPELHLHPAVQARLAKAFVAAIELAKQHGYQLQLLLETHSETIVNYLGRAIARGELKSDDVSVILFEKRLGDVVTSVRNSTFDDNGFLTDWPYGFFSAED